MAETDLHDGNRPGTIRTSAGWATDVGRVRPGNEDAVLVDHPIYLVADGMGGHNAGEVASAITVEEFEKLTAQSGVTIEQLGDSLRAASRRIGELKDGEEPGAGTTVALVATMVIDGVAYWAVLNLGDSRVYRLSDEIFEQVSVDHSVVQELIDRGELTAATARSHPYRHMITKALGAGTDAEPDYWLIPAEPGDRMLICSDGLNSEVEDGVLEQVLRTGGDAQAVSAKLVDLALEAGGHDNVSVVVVDAIEIVGRVRTVEETVDLRGADAPLDAADEDTQPRRNDRDGPIAQAGD